MKMRCCECKKAVFLGKVSGWRSGRTNSRCYNCGSLSLEDWPSKEQLKAEREAAKQPTPTEPEPFTLSDLRQLYINSTGNSAS